MDKIKLFPPEIIEFTVENYFAKQNKGSKIIYIAVVIAVFVVFAILPLIKVDISTQSRGIIRSVQENNSLVSSVYGEVQETNLHENKFVNEGDTLLIINTGKLAEQIAINSIKIDENEKLIYDLSRLVSEVNPQLKTNACLSEYLMYSQKYHVQELQVNQLKKEFELEQQLYKQNVTTRVDFEKKKNALDLAESNLKLIREQQQSEWQSKLVQLELQNKELNSQVKQLEKEKELYIITAPISGTINQYSGIKAGNYIVPNQNIAQISPSENLIVECYVQPKDIGLIQSDMEASFQLDAFNYNQWGSANGKVMEISEDIVTINESPMFKVRCNLQTSCLQLKNGYTGKLKKGMTLTGRFKLTRRSLFDLLHDKTDNWLNPKVKNPV